MEESYNFQGDLTPLPSYSDQNFLVLADTGNRYVIKVSNAAEKEAALEAQNQAMTYPIEHGFSCPGVIPPQSGDAIISVQSSTEETNFVRLISYLPGTPYGKIRRQNAELFKSLGGFLGRLDRVFASFDLPAARHDSPWNLINSLNVVEEYQSFLPDAKFRDLNRKTPSPGAPAGGLHRRNLSQRRQPDFLIRRIP